MADFDLNSAFIPALHKPTALLPIAKHRKALLYLIETKQVTIVVGQTGSGKTTQIPQFLEAAGWCADGKVIGITQPRRVAATTVAVRVAEEFGCEIGKEVGYAIRFEDATSAQTRIKFMTDGLLIREALVDPLLTRYSVIMVDEAHERSISTDILLGLLKKILKKRPDLRVIISSATLQAEEFLKFFTTSPGDGDQKLTTKPGDDSATKAATSGDDKSAIISLEGRTFPVDLLYLESPTENYFERAISTVFDIHENEDEGDILVFLTGREEIDEACQAVADRLLNLRSQEKKLQALPLYAGLTTEQQMYVFDKPPEGTRKVVFATNIAEASITIDGIVYVVDCGFAKLRAYNPTTSIESLISTPISKASANQRAGRAGRTRPGKCFRLYTEESFLSLPEFTVPEVQRSNLAPFILQLKALGIDNVLRFNFLSPPPAELMAKALELLYSLGALDDYAKLTKPLGYRMAEIAVEPMMGKTLLSASSFGCLSEILTIAAMTSAGGNNVWFYHDGERKQMETSRRLFAAEEGDHLTLLNVYQAFVMKGKKESKFARDHNLNFKTLTRAVSIRAQLKRYLEKFGITVEESLGAKGQDNVKKAEQIRRCLTAGYFAHAARMQPDGTFRNVTGETTLHAHPSSLMFNRKADWVIFHEVMETSKKIFIRDITKIEKDWLVEYAPEFYQVVDTSASAATRG
ncbi:putative ATP-dependent RNA helicase DHX35 [Colletotrichum siamense]|uniref:putative ATP-dependent RNA helicase DHX35 n=1 Tax=Colletotrichum siamense TaxID=690259 RepID=UPI00187283C4|nr:putative ATP-dependent RNA helicase DHX35 [Colletotrichum siamense]KAF5511398.1 putative ATP-dependent RNA helicase DHX35 [Colletotrichum siamense]